MSQTKQVAIGIAVALAGLMIIGFAINCCFNGFNQWKESDSHAVVEKLNQLNTVADKDAAKK